MINQNFKHTEIEMISNDWKVVKIADICKVKRGASPRPIGDPSYFSDIGRGWIRISDVTETYKYLRKTSQYLSKKGEGRSVKVNPGDLIMSICATIGKPIILDMEACIHDGFVWFSELSKDVNAEYLFYVLQKNEITFSSKRQTGTQGNINTTLVGKTPLPLPPLPEQKKIAEILSTVDEVIQKVDEATEKTQKLKKGVMQELLTGRLHVVDGRQGKAKREFKETEIGRIPEEWEVVQLENVCKQRNEITQPTGKGLFKFIGLEHIESGENKVTSFGMDSSVRSSKFKFYKDYILYGKLRPYLDKAVITEFEGICSTDLLVLSSENKEIDSRFLIYTIHTDRFISHAISHTSGTNYPRTSWKAISKFKFGIPPLPEQQKIAEILSTVDKKLELLRQRKEKIERIKKGLMDDLLTGKKRVLLEA
jgi:type I restriction enzyme S subunit